MRDGLLDVLRDVQIRRQEVRGAGRNDRDRDIASVESVDAPLHRPVASPYEDELRALLDRATELSGSLATLGHFVPERIRNALTLELASEFEQPAPERLAGVRNDRDGRHGVRASRLRATTLVVRARRRASVSAAIPTRTPASMSSG